MKPRSILINSTIVGILVVNPAQSQVIPDGTTNTTVTDSCQNSCDIAGGKAAGQNLFHSFQDFNIPPGGSAYFNDPGVVNIFSRVTGSNPSEIFGTLGVGGDANLFLLNPNGIVFGNGAALDLNGSFFATTADEIQFGDRTFAANPSQTEDPSLLTVDPSALFFEQMGQNGSITARESELSVAEQKDITLIGAQKVENLPGIDLTNSSLLQAPQGNVFLGAIKNSGRVEISDRLQPVFSGNTALGNISLSQSKIDVSGVGAGSVRLAGDDITLTAESTITANTLGDLDGKEIAISANNLTIADNSSLITSTTGKGNSANIKLEAQDSIELKGRDAGAFQDFVRNTLAGGDRRNNVSSSIYTFSLAEGKTGDIALDSQNLLVQDGAWILASALDRGNAGKIAVDIAENTTINAAGLIAGSAIGSQGQGGAIDLNSKDLRLQNGGIISSSILGQGDGGDINLKVTDSIQLRQNSPNTVVPTGIYTNTLGSSGAAGNLAIDTNSLILDNGSQLSSASGAITNQGLIPIGGRGGNITINAEQIKIDSNSANNRLSTGIVNDTYSDNAAGRISIQTDKLNLSGDALISASAIGDGDGGEIDILARDSINLAGRNNSELEQIIAGSLSPNFSLQNIRSGLLTNTLTGKAGNITVNSPQLNLEKSALISTSTIGGANGGNLNITTEDLNITNSAIVSSTFGRGNAGNIDIDTQRLVTANNGIVATSSIGFGNAGDLKVNATDSIKLLSSSSDLFFVGGIFTTNPSGFGYSGNLDITTKNLVIREGASIDATNGGGLDLVAQLLQNIDLPRTQLDFSANRNIVINAETIEISGTSADGISGSSINSTTTSIFPANDIVINTSQLAIADKGTISVSSLGEGRAGNLTIAADSIRLDRQASLNANTLSGQGGNVELAVEDLLFLDNNSEIVTDASGVGNGGNIDINTTFVVASEASNISARAVSGQGGNIEINARDLFVASDSQIIASSDLGVDGNVNITTFDTSQRNSLVQLPEQKIQTDKTITKSCSSRSNRQGTFFNTGRGGLPIAPLTEFRASNITLPDWEIITPEVATDNLRRTNFRFGLTSTPVVEANSWRVNPQGEIELTASAAKTIISEPHLTDCPFSS